MFEQIERTIDGIKYSVSLEHFPNRKRPLLLVSINGVVRKVGEITDEGMLRLVMSMIFSGYDTFTIRTYDTSKVEE